ncbi:MAG: zinc ribbon domain-containing protein [Kiritimatiellae bacterium]|nr:zinc ribbon domain-containing protein [Kiritimatiellia bacterium]
MDFPGTPACPSCGTENAAGRNFCRACGARLSPAAPPPVSRRSAREKRKIRTQLLWTVVLAFVAGLLLWPVRGGKRGDEAALDRASRKYLALAQALAAGRPETKAFTEAELNAFLAANARDAKNRPVAMSVRLEENGFSLVLPARPPFGASKLWTFRWEARPEPGSHPAALTFFALGHLPVFPPLARTIFLTRTWPAWKEESREVVDFLSALSVSCDGKTLVLSAP